MILAYTEFGGIMRLASTLPFMWAALCGQPRKMHLPSTRVCSETVEEEGKLELLARPPITSESVSISWRQGFSV